MAGAAAAIDLDLFTRTEAGYNTAANIAAACAASQHGAKLLLDALLDAMIGMGYLRRPGIRPTGFTAMRASFSCGGSRFTGGPRTRSVNC